MIRMMIVLQYDLLTVVPRHLIASECSGDDARRRVQ
jgi:hypothetical protein